MSAAASSAAIPAFPTTALASLNSAAAALSNAYASTEFGCPLSDFVSFAGDCALTNVPACVATQVTAGGVSATGVPSIDYNAACCTSISVYAVSVESCLSKSAPSCLDTSALLASATAVEATASFSNPCAPYFGGGGGSGPTAKPASSAKGASGASGASGATGTSGGSTATASGGSTPAAKSNGVSNVGPGLKVTIGLVFMGALAVLAL